ncbi:hypothetical protein BU25DRAFT_392042 [Macroventuria anomochaeta]|uniref:Uncharacterized protein n=1 Tax=Macroventuria anomochaeta TaxID=301207 RepID=A0ACB6S0E0_9PLEO|nr:uncharacterized protein BU25DRAFT_392042 [Macroventuria anomochaeta]KAF2627755.1 hypothetical protein BU25DRAFT_392042 [Macroventuria anomochaeta]
MAARPRRLGQTKDGATPLLRTVGGKPHAREEDREEMQKKKSTTQEGLITEEWDELNLNADPVDPDEVLRAPPKSSKPTPDSDALRKPPGSKPGLRKPAPKKTRPSAPRVPGKGQYEQSRAVKEDLDGDKENANSKQTPPVSSADIWGFGIHSSQTSQKGPKKTFGGGNKTKNIHAAPPATKETNRRLAKSGPKSNQKPEPSSEVRSEGNERDDLSSMGEEEIDNLLDSSDLDSGDERHRRIPEDPELRKVPAKKKKPARINGDAFDSTALNGQGLDNLLKPTLREQLGLTDTQDSSLPPSSAPQEDMDNIDSYVRELPAEAEEGTACPICNEPVDQDYYWDFWKDRNKTVKNQAAFCHTHRKSTAQKEYLAEGYPAKDGVPALNWSRIPERIKKHRMVLHAILAGEKPSIYRTRYEPLALTGKAAAVPSKRTDLSPSKQAELASYALDDNTVYPGYYGPRGRRLITESVMSLLNTEIKRSTDPVVQTSGPATFVQAVLVPEVSVRLIMEDLKVDWDGAEEVRERTFEMGVLLNEEIEDEVVVDEEEGENEYHH